MKSLKDCINEARVNESFNASKIISVLNEIKTIVSNPKKGRKAIWQAFDGQTENEADVEGWRVFSLKFCDWLLGASTDESLFKRIINNWEESSGYEDILDEVTDKYSDMDVYDVFPELWQDIVYSLTKSHVDWNSIV